jgi:muramoyltetrapeptide carboxypeptidase
MIAPMPMLTRGDRVRIVAPSRSVSKEDVLPAETLLENAGWEVVRGEHLFHRFHQYAGTREERAQDLQTALDDPKTKAILCARGGFGCLNLIDMLDFTAFAQHPKWICGFSDITVLQTRLLRLGAPSLHCAMPVNIRRADADQVSVKTLLQVLREGKLDYRIPSHRLNVSATAQGILCGGNLSMLCALNGSASDMETEGKILFIEDTDEYLYHIDRMMLTLKRSGKLSRLSGLIAGSFSDMHDHETGFGMTAQEIIRQHTQEYGYPICFDFPSGHIQDSCALILGANAVLRVEDGFVELHMTAV